MGYEFFCLNFNLRLLIIVRNTWLSVQNVPRNWLSTFVCLLQVLSCRRSGFV